ncbi:MAG: transglycosylase domain-containing protein [Myxococcales bacterium]
MRQPILRRASAPSPHRLADEPDEDALTDPRFFLVRRFAPGLLALPLVWRRRLRAAAAVAGSLLGLLVALRLAFWLPPISRWLAAEAHRAVSERLRGAEIRGGVHAGWFGSVRLDDLRVPGPTPGAPPTLSAEEVIVRPALGQLLRGRLRVADIELRWVRLHPGVRGEALKPLLARPETAPSAAPRRERRAPPSVSVRDLYVDLPLQNAADTATLGPLSFRARWSHEKGSWSWDVEGGLLDGHAGRFSLTGQADPASGSARAVAKLDRVKLVELPPGWFQGLSMQPLDGAISGEIAGERSASGAALGKTRLEITGLSLSWPRLDPQPVSPLDIGASGDWRWEPASRAFSVTNGKLSVNGGVLGVQAAVTLGQPRSIDVDLSIAQLDLQKTIDALPKALQPPPQAPRVEGELAAELSFGGPLGDLDGIEIRRAEVDLKSLRQAAKHDPAAEFLSRPFRYTPRDDEGPHRTFEVGPSNPRYVAYASLPGYVPKAIVASEDAGFFGHHGFDFDEIKDSIARDLETGEAVRGGSTLTQQLVKNLFLTRSKTLSRKIREALITLQVEATLPKWRILEIYLNTIEWGPDVYGIGEASWRWFGVPAARLSPKEAAFLATVIPNPKRFWRLYLASGAVTPRWEERVDRLIDRMHGFGYLDDATWQAALAEPIAFHHGAVHDADRSAEPQTSRTASSLWERLFGR